MNVDNMLKSKQKIKKQIILKKLINHFNRDYNKQ